MQYDEMDALPYRKRKTKAPKPPKSSHKHSYLDCLLTYSENNILDSNIINQHCIRAKYCSVCGKITGKILFETDGNRLLLSLTEDDMQQRYPLLKVYKIDKYGDKFIKI